MINFEPGLSKYNNAPPPTDFIKKNAWEIKERVPIKGKIFTPSKLPSHDSTTKYIEATGRTRYLVEEKPTVGAGGMSSVFRGWDSRLERYVAVKELLPGWLDLGELYKNTIELEAKIIEKLKKNFHPGIPNIYDFIETKTLDGKIRPLLIMELIEGESLHSRLYDNEQPLTIFEITNIITQTADTVDFMNKNGLFHNDIKPKNIILNQPHIKIIDYGSSSWIPEADTVTPSYTSPEICAGTFKGDARSDEFSLAATAYSVFFGNPPDFFNKQEILTEEQFYSKNFKYKVNNNDIKQLINIFEKSLSKNPDDRYQTSTEFARAFCEIIKNIELKK